MKQQDQQNISAMPHDMVIMVYRLMMSSLCSVTWTLAEEIKVRMVHQNFVISKGHRQSSDGIMTEMDLKAGTITWVTVRCICLSLKHA